MTAEDKESLRAWAKNWHEGIFLVQGRQALELLAENEQLAAEVERLKSGNFTEDEFQNLCHNEPVQSGKERFKAGCVAYCAKLFAGTET